MESPWAGRFALVASKRRTPDLVGEAVYVLSLAQEFMGPEEVLHFRAQFEVWLMLMRAGNAAVVKATAARSLLDALEVDEAEAGKLIGPSRALRMEVGEGSDSG